MDESDHLTNILNILIHVYLNLFSLQISIRQGWFKLKSIFFLRLFTFFLIKLDFF